MFSYFISRRSSAKRGILLGNLISLFHALSGIGIVLILYFIMKTAYLSSFEAISHKVMLVSYSLIVVIGLGLLLNSLFHMRKRPSPVAEKRDLTESPDQKGMLPLALAVGMVPCPGVVIIMLFALSANLLATGLVMSFMMALGMAATISSAGVLTVLGKEGLLRGLSRKERAQHIVQKSLNLLGSLLIIAFGAMLLSTVI